jgi:hypothetical protein
MLTGCLSVTVVVQPTPVAAVPAQGIQSTASSPQVAQAVSTVQAVVTPTAAPVSPSNQIAGNSLPTAQIIPTNTADPGFGFFDSTGYWHTMNDGHNHSGYPGFFDKTGYWHTMNDGHDHSMYAGFFDNAGYRHTANDGHNHAGYNGYFDNDGWWHMNGGSPMNGNGNYPNNHDGWDNHNGMGGGWGNHHP